MENIDNWIAGILSIAVIALITHGIRAWRDGRIYHTCFGTVTKKRTSMGNWIGDEYSCQDCGIAYFTVLSLKNPEETEHAEDPA